VVLDPGASEPFDHIFKVVAIGEVLSGRSCLLHRLATGRFDPDIPATIGLGHTTLVFWVDQKSVMLNVVDFSGQECYKSMCSPYNRNANGFIGTYAITDCSSLGRAHGLEVIQNSVTHGVLGVLVGNKTDLEHCRCITIEHNAEMAMNWGLEFVEMSVKNGSNIIEPFSILIDDMITKAI
jgi:small GTP-binding protein